MNTNTVAQSDYAANAYTENVQQTTKKSAVTNGKTIGDPQLSEKAQKYYEQLRKKFSNMDFILVSADKKEEAQANAAQYANANHTVVLIDTDKIEKMAEDEAYRKKYEGIISGAQTQLAQIRNYLAGKYKKTQVALEFEKKPELIAGFVLRVGDIEEDFSIRGRLDRLQQKLTWR